MWELFHPRLTRHEQHVKQVILPRSEAKRMSPIPRPVNCPHRRLVKLIQFKGEHVIYYRCELCGAHITMREQ